MGTHGTRNPEEGLHTELSFGPELRSIRAHLLNVVHTLYYFFIIIFYYYYNRSERNGLVL